jgi:hypothetical protein
VPAAVSGCTTPEGRYCGRAGVFGVQRGRAARSDDSPSTSLVDAMHSSIVAPGRQKHCPHTQIAAVGEHEAHLFAVVGGGGGVGDAKASEGLARFLMTLSGSGMQ